MNKVCTAVGGGEDSGGGRVRILLLGLAVALLGGLTYGVLFIRGHRQGDVANKQRPELALGRSPSYDYDPPAPGSYRLATIKPAGDGSVLDTDGKPRRLREILKGHITILSFIYTRCGDSSACPHATSVLFNIHSMSEQDPVIAKNLRLVTFSFDPEYDTPQILADYSQALRQSGGSEWLFLTTRSQKELAPILKAFGQRVDRKKNPKDPLGPYNHLLRVYLIDQQGMIRNIYSSGLLDPRLVLTDVRTLLLEEEGAATGLAE